MNHLVNGKCRQNGFPVHKYYNMFRRHADQIPDLTEDTKIAFFRTGLDEEVREHSLRDIHGARFSTVDALVDHLAVLEIRKRGLGIESSKKRKMQPKSYSKHKHRVAATKRPNASGGSQALHSDGVEGGPHTVATTKKVTGVSRGRGFSGSRGTGRGGTSGRGSGPSNGRGNSRGGGRTGRTGPTWWESTDMAAPFKGNHLVSQEQALWLRENKRCYRCTKPQSECTRTETVQCTTQACKSIPGCPVWKSG